MNTFTDNDLKRLKENLKHYSPHVPLSTVDGTALLARLEAAEQCFTERECDCMEIPCWHRKSLEKWRKAAGK